jgi:anti-sigma-K factor RskA
MTCDQIEELIAAYALDALSEDDLAQADAHLAGCRRHDQALAEYRRVVDRLGVEMEPSAGLRTRLLAAFDAEAASQAPARPVAISGWRRAAERRPAFWMAAAAVLLAAAAGLATWGLVLQFDEGAAGARVSAFAGDAGTGQLIYLPDDRIAVLQLDLQPPDAGHSYQAWGIFDGRPVSLGLLPDAGVAAFNHDLSDAQAVAISVEPLGGSDQPTTEPILVAALD